MNKQTEALKMQLGDIIDGMRTKAINNVTIKSSTLERFADELNQFEIELHKALEQPACKHGVDDGCCKEALEHQEVGDAEIKQMLDDIEYYKNRLAKYEDVL